MTSPRKPSPRSGEIRLHGSPKGEIGKALAKSLSEARRAGRLPAALSVAEVLATRMAGVADAAWRVSDHRTFMVAVGKLGPLLRSLGLAELALTPEGGDADDDDPDPGTEGPADTIERELAEILAAGPEVRHSKNAGA